MAASPDEIRVENLENVPVGDAKANEAAIVQETDSAATNRWGSAKQAVKEVGVSSQFRTLRKMRTGKGFMTASSLAVDRELGKGAFGKVLRYNYTAEGKVTPVAVKQILPELMDDPEELKHFKEEMDLMSKLSNSHLVGYLGVLTLPDPDSPSKPEVLCILTEYCDGGSLFELLVNQSFSPSTRRPLYSRLETWQWLKQLAQGLQYLHEAQPQVIHRDMKPDNIMLVQARNFKDATQVRDVKMCDFGMATLVDKRRQQADENADYQLTGGTGSDLYMAPEVFKNEPYNSSVDVFSFGVIAYELLTRKTIISQVTEEGEKHEVRAYAERVSNGFRMSFEGTRIPESTRELISDCWSQDPSKRPAMPEILSRLAGMKEMILDMDPPQVYEDGSKTSTGCQCTVM